VVCINKSLKIKKKEAIKRKFKRKN